MESLLHDIRRPGVERIEGQRRIEVGELQNSFDAHEVCEENRAAWRLRGIGFCEKRQKLRLDSSPVLMKVSRVQQELGMLRPEDAALFRDAALAQNQRLPTTRQSGANHRPFLERNRKHHNFSYLFVDSRWRAYFSCFCLRVMRSCTAASGGLPSCST